MRYARVSREILRFTGVGAVNSVLYVVVAATLNGLVGLATITASVIAYALAATFAYLAHRHLTFRSRGAAPAEVSRFIAATALGLALALLIPVLLLGFAPMVSFLAVLVVVPPCSFMMMKFFVFRA